MHYTKRETDNYGFVETDIHFTDGMLYAIYVDLGTPYQTVGLILDTGSSDIWVKSSKSTSCIPYSYNATIIETFGTLYPYDCYYYGLFNPDSSTSYVNNNTDFFLDYMTGFSNGTWSKDSFNLNGAIIDDYTFGLSNYTDINPGVFGIGLIPNEQTVNKYQNFPARLKDDNYIGRNFYSLFLNKGINATGNLLFGAIDHAKYTGDLKTFNVVKEKSLMIGDLVNISFNNQTLSPVPAGALFDCGATEISFPDAVFDQLLNLLNISEPYAIVDCNNKADEIIKFDFDGFKFDIPVSALYYDNGDGTCTFVAGPMGADNQMSLGIEFMKYAYVIFDLDNKQISLGHPNYTTEKDIQVIDENSSFPNSTSSTGSNQQYEEEEGYDTEIETDSGDTQTVVLSINLPNPTDDPILSVGDNADSIISSLLTVIDQNKQAVTKTTFTYQPTSYPKVIKTLTGNGATTTFYQSSQETQYYNQNSGKNLVCYLE